MVLFPISTKHTYSCILLNSQNAWKLFGKYEEEKFRFGDGFKKEPSRAQRFEANDIKICTCESQAKKRMNKPFKNCDCNKN